MKKILLLLVSHLIVGAIGFIVPVPDTVDPGAFNTVIVWCEAFAQFITAAQYR